MPITPLLANQAFEQEEIEGVVTTFIAVCSRLGSVDRSNKVTENVAQMIIELAQCGVRNPDTAQNYLEEFNVFEE